MICNPFGFVTQLSFYWPPCKRLHFVTNFGSGTKIFEPNWLLSFCNPFGFKNQNFYPPIVLPSFQIHIISLTNIHLFLKLQWMIIINFPSTQQMKEPNNQPKSKLIDGVILVDRFNQNKDKTQAPTTSWNQRPTWKQVRLG